MSRKLIEVAPFLPLDAISVAAKADKDKKTGTIKNVHKWFAPMPTPALRALIFAAVVDAPDDEDERRRLLSLVERLVPPGGNPPDEATLAEARAEIERSTGGELPTIFDPFCGGGSTLIEAQRLGLPAIGSDLNPVPVLISRTLTELIPQVAGRPALVGDPAQLGSMAGGALDGLLADVRHYAERVRGRVWDEVGHLYPQGPNGETIIAWLWAWTVTCPNPACKATMPLLSNLWLSKRTNDRRWIDIAYNGRQPQFSVGGPHGRPMADLKFGGNRPKFRCARCRDGIADEGYLRSEGEAGRMTAVPTVTAMDLDGRRAYVASSELPPVAEPEGSYPFDVDITDYSRWFSPPSYGLTGYADLFRPRQLTALTAFAEAIAEVPEQVATDGGDEVYGKAITSILGLALGKLAMSHSTQARWYVGGDSGSNRVQAAFSRHALPMVWDFVEINPFCERMSNWNGVVKSVFTGLAALPLRSARPGAVRQSDARSAASSLNTPVVIVTDPPYFDQIGYADLSDYFYIWHRQALRKVHPDLYGTIVTPKDEELIATPYRHKGKEAAARYFVDGFTETFRSLKTAASDDHPILIVYAHRQEESSSLGAASTGWDAMLEAVLAAGLTIEGTLPVRGTGSSRQIGQGTNSLASYIVMVCRPRTADAAPATIAQFRTALRERLPDAVAALLATGESMVDIRQAAIGPGMEVFCQFKAVYDGGEQIPVRRALTIINEELGRLLDEQLGAVDDETRWACQWYADHCYEPGEYDEARKLAGVYALGVDGLRDAGLVDQGSGKVRLLTRAELPAGWMGDDRTPTWEACQHLVKRLAEGEQAAGELLAALGPAGWGVRDLALYLTNLAIEQGWSDEAIAYDALVTSWPRIEELAARAGDNAPPASDRLFEA